MCQQSRPRKDEEEKKRKRKKQNKEKKRKKKKKRGLCNMTSLETYSAENVLILMNRRIQKVVEEELGLSTATSLLY